MLKNRLLYRIVLALFSFAFMALVTSCHFSLTIDEEYNENEYSRMIDHVEITQKGKPTEYIYFNYDYNGRVSTIEDTYYGTYDEFFYDDYNGIIVVEHGYYKKTEILVDNNYNAIYENYYENDWLRSSFEYNYRGGYLSSVWAGDYDDWNNLVSEHEYYLDYDYRDNLEEISYSYYERGYSVKDLIEFTEFSQYYNDYNIDILSIIEFYINGGKASRIGITGYRSERLPSEMIVTYNYNDRDERIVRYDLNYTYSNGQITRISLESNYGDQFNYYITYTK